MTKAVAAVEFERSALRPGVTVRALVVGLLGFFAFDNLLLLHFWGLPLSLTVGLAALAAIAISALSARISNALPTIPLTTLAITFFTSLVLFALGGEGHFFYANIDWQIRDAVLRDMASNPWPFAYEIGGPAYFLRAPVGMYLLPAMFGAHAELVLLASNALRLALLLTLARHLFDTRRERAIALAVCILFSGWDIVGTALYSSLGVHLSWDHIEAWNFGYQYSSHVTQAFWVPQHAIAGWSCAVAFLLWRKGLVPLGVFAASIPLVAIWSPLAIMGAIPFALFAGIVAWKRNALNWNDFALATIGLAISLPALFYLKIDAASVGMHFLAPRLLFWTLCIGLEVLPFAWPLLFASGSQPIDRQLVTLIVILLFVMPLVQVGVSADFQMRASIMPLALLSILFARWTCTLLAAKPAPIFAIAYAVLAIGLGAATPLLEVRRALVNGPSPRPLCSLIGVWNKQDNMIVPYASYLAPVAKLPPAFRDVPVTAGRSDPARCWDRKWVVPTHD